MLDLEDDVDKLQSNIADAVNEICPVKTNRCTKPFAPWINQYSDIQAQLHRNRFKKVFSEKYRR